MRYRVILADPPWAFDAWSDKGKGRSPEKHYGTEGTDRIASLPVREVTAKDAVLLLWATNPRLPDALAVAAVWGFRYVTMFTWVKMTAGGVLRIGLGYHARSCTEHLVVATCGSPPAPTPGERPAGALFSPPGPHSSKPHTQYEIAEGYPGPYLEMFHRPGGPLFTDRPGWTFAGNEVDGLDMEVALQNLAARPVPKEVVMHGP